MFKNISSCCGRPVHGRASVSGSQRGEGVAGWAGAVLAEDAVCYGVGIWNCLSFSAPLPPPPTMAESRLSALGRREAWGGREEVS